MLLGIAPSAPSNPIAPRRAPSAIVAASFTIIMPLSESAAACETWSVFFGVCVPIPTRPVPFIIIAFTGVAAVCVLKTMSASGLPHLLSMCKLKLVPLCQICDAVAPSARDSISPALLALVVDFISSTVPVPKLRGSVEPGSVVPIPTFPPLNRAA